MVRVRRDLEFVLYDCPSTSDRPVYLGSAKSLELRTNPGRGSGVQVLGIPLDAAEAVALIKQLLCLAAGRRYYRGHNNWNRVLGPVILHIYSGTPKIVLVFIEAPI